MTSFHVYTHQDNSINSIENCQLCELAVLNQSVEFLVEAVFVFIAAQFLVSSKRKSFFHTSELPSLLLRLRLFGRPPPKVN